MKYWLHYPRVGGWAGVGMGAGVGAGVGAEMPTEAIYRQQIEAAAPNLVLTAPRRALRSPTSQLRTILKVLQMLYSNTLILAIWV